MQKDALEVIRFDLEEAQEALRALIESPQAIGRIRDASQLIVRSLRAGGKVLSCGNGGSLCDAMHFAEEMTGRFRDDRPAYSATAISDASHLACVGNDYGYEKVFSRYVEGVGRPEDVLLAISTSGTSRNVLEAARAARAKGMAVIGLTGRPGTPLEELSTVTVVTPGGRYADRVQELHIKVIHILIELTERSLNPENYSD